MAYYAGEPSKIHIHVPYMLTQILALHVYNKDTGFMLNCKIDLDRDLGLQVGRILPETRMRVLHVYTDLGFMILSLLVKVAQTKCI